jgi:hypothetical protein
MSEPERANEAVGNLGPEGSACYTFDHRVQFSKGIAVVSIRGARRLVRRVRHEVPHADRRCARHHDAEVRHGSVELEASFVNELQ